jgi:hypothetical protein
MVHDPAQDHDWQATIIAALLRQGRWPAQLSIGLSLLAAASALFALSMGMPLCAAVFAASFAAGLAVLWLALRVGFDAELFQALAVNGDLAGFDRAMGALRLMPANRAGRSLERRIEGALRLLRAQGLALGLQVVLLGVGALLAMQAHAP